ncbi:tetraacyldisaccharide 4'-kinase [Bermanella marisrubri]|uniref:Tetraacyldisaccharide 4'-kinase n=1 Tax=Bermanella marisrubri TaxID=207949 RepID=Q1N4W2_9GAMM|nr:tetraacyldisaccharide 4'-kinase [Bermanella marisrubri]EAT13316.1 tetraacyldisaccharide 4'-kinase [Oceanobacter sp. RED65] [Bermanella marisrubri]QIZ84076.1 tetraacyldisaccharide 4'-kinase [Bermanella marisrubri]
MLERLFNKAWYGTSRWTLCLLPLAWLYAWVVKRKRRQAMEQEKTSPVTTIVVGNITVGGTGKTPIVQALVRFLKKQGYQPGIISRGYGGDCNVFPHLIEQHDTVSWTGDEPFMLAKSLQVPVVIDPVRTRGIQRLMEQGVDIVVSDDGLQHYDMARDIEICVVDGVRGLGNGNVLPVGPLREPYERINSVDFVLASGHVKEVEYQFSFHPRAWVNVKTNEERPVDSLELQGQCSAIAGIGNPQKFFNTLEALGVEFQSKAFPDHHAYNEADFRDLAPVVLMTEKDAVKVANFAHENMWALSIDAKLDLVFYTRFSEKLSQLRGCDG